MKRAEAQEKLRDLKLRLRAGAITYEQYIQYKRPLKAILVPPVEQNTLVEGKVS